MNIESTRLVGLKIIHPSVFSDERGFFMEVYRQDKLRAEGIDVNFVQASHSSSKSGILRGLHFQWDKPLGKLIRVIRGRAFVVAVDIKKKSSTCGQWFGIELSDENKTELWMPAGFASGFCVLGEGADVEYQYTAIYNPNGESNIIWNDPEIGINWPIQNPVLSPRDANASSLAVWLSRPEADVFIDI